MIINESQQGVINYYHHLGSRIGYRLLLNRTKHFGYYPAEKKHISMKEAVALMEDKLAEKLNVPRGAHILDAGCGEGNVAITLAEKYGYKITAIDIRDWALKIAEKRVISRHVSGSIELGLMDYTDLQFPDKSFDAVYTMETLVHASDYVKALKEFYRVLKPGGKLTLFEYSIRPPEALTPEQKRVLDAVIEGSAMHSLPYFIHGEFPLMLRKAGLTSINVEVISERILPMLRIFHHLAWLPYQLVSFFGLESKAANITTGAEGYRYVKEDIGRYNIITAIKP